jgi:mannose-6-phosphate isomerase-like protein (cupin superfamily)
MFTRSKRSAPTRSRQGMTTHVLLQLGDVAKTDLTVTWVDVEPAGAQGSHSHEPEQVYVIVVGAGRMHVDGEAREVGVGDLVHVPSGADHFIVNIGDGPLSYLSVATPAFSQTDFYDEGKL